LGVNGGSGPSIAAGGVDFFLVSFSTDLPENIYNVKMSGGREGGREGGRDLSTKRSEEEEGGDALYSSISPSLLSI